MNKIPNKNLKSRTIPSKQLIVFLMSSSLLSASTFILYGCDEAIEPSVDAVFYSSLQQCLQDNRFTAQKCQSEWNKAVQINRNAAPIYEAEEDCVEENGSCEKVLQSSGAPVYRPPMSGYIIHSEPYSSSDVGYLEDLFLDSKNSYWIEQLEHPFCFQFTTQEIELIHEATQTVHDLTHLLLEKIVISAKYEAYMQRLGIPQAFWEPIRVSWERDNPEDFELYGRFDGIFSDDQFKILEYNADTPTFVCEFLHQWLWLQDLKSLGKLSADADQFNSLDLALKKQFQFLAHQYGLLRRNSSQPVSLLHFTVMLDAPEDEDTVLFLMAMASEVGINSKLTYLEKLGFDENACLVDQDNWLITHLFKLYPWENIVEDELLESRFCGQFPFRDAILKRTTQFLEPIWKMLLSNKGIWAFMYEEFPQCPFLLATYFSDDFSLEAMQLRDRVHVEKPLISREGANTRIVAPDPRIGDLCKRSGPYHGATIVQEFFTSSDFNGYYPVIGSWYIGEPSGIAIRADKSLITGNRSLFVPHYIGGLTL